MVKLNVGVLQLNPRIGSVKANIEQANTILASHGYLTPLTNITNGVKSHVPRSKLDLLILPELAFTGYNFKSPLEIKPYLEPTTSGVSTEWAKQTSRALGCHVLVGYPEKYFKKVQSIHETSFPTNITSKISNKLSGNELTPTLNDDHDYTVYNSAVMVSPTGSVLFNYRKSFLYDADETWGCSESPTMKNGPDSPDVFPLTGIIMIDQKNETGSTVDQLNNRESLPKIPLKVQVGICMDLNPYKFQSPFSNFEFAHAAIHNDASLILCPMAWLHSKSPDIPKQSEFDGTPEAYDKQRKEKLHSIENNFNNDPSSADMSNVNYWIHRMSPLFRDEYLSSREKTTYKHKKILMATCNRSGIEDYTAYAGSSSIYVFNEDKKIGYYGSLGQGEESLMVCEVEVDE
ncbi:uncharacterized protein SAPINGB_P003587 [Magnusiomyces paraingens]|uniref:CN hydrolase domain-containing protein n=1 Tax=Magnusiomyces paraingens TaxID=2606893 RepID=A0A5E8BXK2_9ASCO|nr:uncharacterized protein SAPINGB_P003587 [Saprochaete ingens]VVT53465.1 unnamed protein product [Saprochaete ingens]